MELIQNELLETIPKLYETERSLNPICHIKLFTPDSQWSWYIIEIDENQDVCYGYVQGLECELGYFSLEEELKQIKGPLGLPIERDISFTPTALSIIRNSSVKS